MGDFSQHAGLIQAGVQTRSISGTRTLTPFFEYINVAGGCCGLKPGNSTVGTGQLMAVDVYWTSTTNACFQILDASTDTLPVNSCLNVNSAAGVPHDTSSAEWFIEDSLPIGLYFENLNQIPWTSMSLSEQAQQYPRWHSPFNYNYMVYQIRAAPKGSGNMVGTCVPGSGPNGILSYPVHEASTDAANGQMDINTNAVNGCTSG